MVKEFKHCKAWVSKRLMWFEGLGLISLAFMVDDEMHAASPQLAQALEIVGLGIPVSRIAGFGLLVWSAFSRKFPREGLFLAVPSL